MHSTAARTNRSSVQSSISSATSLPSAVHPGQQQILYGSVLNPTLSLQACASGLHPSLIPPGTACNATVTNPAPLHMQGKSSRWPPKSKLLRNQQYYEQQQQHQQQQQQHQHIQQQLSYSPKPMVFFDQGTNGAPPAAPVTSFLIASSTYTHGSFSAGEQYSNSGVALIPQPFYKTPDVQTFCLTQDRQRILQQQQQQQEQQASLGSFYGIATTNTCNLQAVNANSTFQFTNRSPYAVAATNFPPNRIPGPVQAVHANQIYSNPAGNAIPYGSGNLQPVTPALEASKSKASGANSARIVEPTIREGASEWASRVLPSGCSGLLDARPDRNDVCADEEIVASSLEKLASNASTEMQEERYSDESLASFDFAIEAEKMVSALCSTSANEIGGKEERRNDKAGTTPVFNGAGDTASNRDAWFPEFCADYESAGTSVAIQTEEACSSDGSQFPELLRKVVYWGCTEAELVLSSSSSCCSSPKDSSPRSSWLRNLSAATKTAVTKSLTCFPIFAGDRVLVNDLINSLLRIGNGWLILDNYLNKKHYPSLDEKFDRGLVRCFRLWEESTHELLNQIVRTFLKLEESTDSLNPEEKSESFGATFPGDVSAYTNRDLFDPSAKHDSGNKKNGQDPAGNVSSMLPSESLRSFSLHDVGHPEKRAFQRESKLRSKWTVTENVATINGTKSAAPDAFLGHVEPGGQTSNRFRPRGGSSSAKPDPSAQSLSAEFFHLRSKVLTENGQDCGKRWLLKGKERERAYPGNETASHESIDPILRLEHRSEENYGGNYSEKCLSRVESSFLNPSINIESVCFPSNADHEHFYPCYAMCPPYTLDYANGSTREYDRNRGDRRNMNLVYVGKSSTSQLELSSVPKDRMTLLSQIEPSIPEKSSEEITANLSAWFASMRNTDSRRMPFVNPPDANTETIVSRGPTRAELSRSTMDLGNCIRHLQLGANRQFHTVQNVQTVPAAPWNAYNGIDGRVQVVQIPEEYDSSEDVRVYMKPGSYNVPRKKHQRRSSRRLDGSASRNAAGTSNTNNHRNYYANREKVFGVPASSTPVSHPPAPIANTGPANTSSSTPMKLAFPATPIVPPPAFSLENSPRILKRSDYAESSSYAMPEDVTWRAACASAEILLEALNVKDGSDSKSKEVEQAESNERDEDATVATGDCETRRENQGNPGEGCPKTPGQDNDGCDGVSSYEASEEDSGSPCRFSPNATVNEVSHSSGSNRNGSSKVNVKTDSWLIKTLSNANMASKQKRRKNDTESPGSESSNSSATENERSSPAVSLLANSTVTTVATSTTVKNLQQTICAKKNVGISSNGNAASLKDTGPHIVGKATYSETVRRCASFSASFSEKKEFCRKGKLNAANVSTICSTVVPIPARKCPRKDCEKSYYLLHNKPRKCSGRRPKKICDPLLDPRPEDLRVSKSTIAMKRGKSKADDEDDNNGCIECLDGKFGGRGNDRGWSIWYSSKRKQSLSPLALSKLETIHRTVWQMEEAEIFKCPSSGNGCGTRSFEHTIEDYCKVIKSPMFLETVEYKLKNRVYHKVEHVVRDFRRIVYNSKLYHKDDRDRVKMIETLSKKLEELFEEHFANWDFDNISGSPRESTSVLQRYEPMEQRQATGRYNHSRKSSPSSATENV